jgi:hypothetical protein
MALNANACDSGAVAIAHRLTASGQACRRRHFSISLACAGTLTMVLTVFDLEKLAVFRQHDRIA